ncbi:MAG: alkaline shock response membrane anchor protein AmaP [Candidatus Omnitrophica bacterium]|nr:alkaline shock response membrane anchor protein AmaP [Candidatus Omnitrophota bacterium]
MRVFTRLAMLFYSVIILFVGSLVVSFTTHTIALIEANDYLDAVYNDTNLCFVISVISVVVMFLSLLFARIIIGGQQKEKVIAFDNPSGRVSISLSALEDMIKRAVAKISEVKEIKPSILATKKGIEVTSRLVLKSDVSIPDMTARLQELIKGRVQDVLGIEENVSVKIHVTKIVPSSGKEQSRKSDEVEQKENLSVPFQGYRK